MNALPAKKKMALASPRRNFMVPMIKLLLLITLMVLCGGTATAQSPSGQELQTCLLLTDDGTWTKLKLTPDQWERMREVRKACKEECEAPGAKHEDNPISNANGSTVLSELRNILTADQYRDWVGFCAENHPGGSAPK